MFHRTVQAISPGEPGRRPTKQVQRGRVILLYVAIAAGVRRERAMSSAGPTLPASQHLPGARPIRAGAWLPLLVIIVAAVSAPAAVLGATPPGTTGGSGIVPEPSLLSVLIEAGTRLLAIALPLGLVIGLAFLVARVGGPAVARSSTGGETPGSQPGSNLARAVALIVAVIAGVGGVLAGRAIANLWGVGGLGINDGAVLLILVVMAVVGLALIGLIATAIRHGQVSLAIGTILATSGLLAAGTFGGNATTAATGGLRPPAPVVLESAGEASLTMPAGVPPFAAHDHGRATCSSVPDGRTVGTVTALELGKLGSGTLRATLTLPAQASSAATAEFWIDGADVPEGWTQPFWTGSVLVTGLGPGQASGRLNFAGLARETDPNVLKGGSPAPTSAVSNWPVTITGVVSWTCQPW